MEAVTDSAEVHLNQAQWHLPALSMRQEDWNFKAGLDYVASSTPPYATQWFLSQVKKILFCSTQAEIKIQWQGHHQSSHLCTVAGANVRFFNCTDSSHLSKAMVSRSGGFVSVPFYSVLSAVPEREQGSFSISSDPTHFISNPLSIQFFPVSVLSQEPRATETCFLADEAAGELPNSLLCTN